MHKLHLYEKKLGNGIKYIYISRVLFWNTVLIDDFLTLSQCSHSTDTIQHFILEFTMKVSEKYRKAQNSRDFILDILKLNVPNLFSSTGEPEENGIPVEDRFVKFLRDYIQRNNLRPVLIERIQEILSLVSEEKPTIYHWMILDVVQQVSTCTLYTCTYMYVCVCIYYIVSVHIGSDS